MLAWSDVMPDPYKVERTMLDHFAPARVDPNPKCEWFRISEAQALAYLNTLRRRPLTATHAQTAAAEEEWYSDDPAGEET